MYHCEPAMITYARQFFHEVKQLPDVKITLYGEGLLQHMALVKKDEKVVQKKNSVIAFSTPLTITPKHIQEMKKLHRNPIYGLSGKKHKDVVLKLSQALKTTSILDYGCGKGSLGNNLPFPIWEYDPAVDGKDSVPRPADLVVCFNVLECIEPEMIDNVLGDLVRCSRKCVYIIIESTDKNWWEKKLNHFFKVGSIIPSKNELHCVLEPRKMGPLA